MIQTTDYAKKVWYLSVGKIYYSYR